MPDLLWRIAPTGRFSRKKLPKEPDKGATPQVADDYFGATAAASPATVYIGARGQGVVHLGARTPAQIYFGPRQLYP